MLVFVVAVLILLVVMLVLVMVLLLVMVMLMLVIVLLLVVVLLLVTPCNNALHISNHTICVICFIGSTIAVVAIIGISS